MIKDDIATLRGKACLENNRADLNYIREEAGNHTKRVQGILSLKAGELGGKLQSGRKDELYQKRIISGYYNQGRKEEIVSGANYIRELYRKLYQGGFISGNYI